jgi:hypothetical protein
MNWHSKQFDLKDRTRNYAVRIVRFVENRSLDPNRTILGTHRRQHRWKASLNSVLIPHSAFRIPHFRSDFAHARL